MKTDSEIQKDVMAELNWEAKLNAIKPTEIGVAVKNGVVTLTGTLDSYSKKLAAEKAAIRVSGVKAIANDIEVKLWSGFKKTDTEIAESIVNAIKWSTTIPEDKIKVKVEDGWVTLEGEVNWEFQKNSAKRTIEDLRGVKGVTNSITISAALPTISEVKSKIEAALKRNVNINGERITVNVSGGKVTLSGKVRSFSEKYSAESAAWSAPGVHSLENNLEVVPSEVYA